ncbi:hypothetical protein [Aquipluma nitroreducens]|uniref:hypothetical protein n=1 Tax=Aquipluma nitroreducens TaxID=2010828 RepID=UPI00296E942D|nr:hypothetical protein [Aquipluma nitroreducens]
MKVYKTEEVRNITLIGNAGSGKTTLAEAMLFEGGVINRRGDVGSKIRYPTTISSSRNTATPYFHRSCTPKSTAKKSIFWILPEWTILAVA